MASGDTTQLERTLIAYFRSIDPKHDADARRELEEIRSAVEAAGSWEGTDEWRISTWNQATIAKEIRDGKAWYRVSVACDGQTLSCGCPTIEKAFGFYRFYCHLIIYQFYSVGPPWADNGMFAP